MLKNTENLFFWKKQNLSIIILGLILISTGCSKKNKTEFLQNDTKNSPLINYVSPEKNKDVEETKEDIIKLDYPIAVIIDNSIDSYPQSSLQYADFVYEFPVEGGITRFLAIFSSIDKLNKIGPIRSVRPYVLDWVKGFNNPILMHVGGSPDSLYGIQERNIINIDEASWHEEFFLRKREKTTPHNIYTEWSLLNNIKEKINLGVYEANNDLLIKEEDSLENRGNINIDQINFVSEKYNNENYSVSWKYNKEENEYIRQQEIKQSYPEDVSAVKAKNVVILYAEGKILDQLGRLNIRTLGKGNAKIFQNGKLIDGKWEKNNSSSKIIFYDNNKQEIKFNKGLTWIEVVVEKLDKISLQDIRKNVFTNNDSVNKFKPKIYNNNIIWLDKENNLDKLVFKEGDNDIVFLSTRKNNDNSYYWNTNIKNHSISNNYIIWEEYFDYMVCNAKRNKKEYIAKNGECDPEDQMYGSYRLNKNIGIFVYNIKTKETYIIKSHSEKSITKPSLYGNYVVYYDKLNWVKSNTIYGGYHAGNIYLYNLDSKKEIKLTTNGKNYEPVVFNNIVAWFNNENVYYKELDTEKISQITNDSDFRGELFANDKYILWNNYGTNDQKVYHYGTINGIEYYDIKKQKIKKLPADSINKIQREPMVIGDLIMYYSPSNKKNNIFFYSIVDNLTFQFNEDINNPLIVNDVIIWSPDEHVLYGRRSKYDIYKVQLEDILKSIK